MEMNIIKKRKKLKKEIPKKKTKYKKIKNN